VIKRIQALHYRALKQVDINLSNFQILVGPNASGKSTFIDIMTFINELISREPVKAIHTRSRRFDELLWNQSGTSFELAVELEIPREISQRFKVNGHNKFRYEIAIAQDKKEGVIIQYENAWLVKTPNESLSNPESNQQISIFPVDKPEPKHIITTGRKTPAGWRKVISKSPLGNDFFRSEMTKWNIIYRFGSHKSSLAGMPEDEERFPITHWARQTLLDGIEFIQLNSKMMKNPCRPDLPIEFQPDGSNLPLVVQYLKTEHPDNYQNWLEHVETAIPEIKAINIIERPEDRYLYLTIANHNGLELPSWVLSDGTLRLLALTIIAYLPVEHKVYLIEEPENGLHPLAIETVYQSLSSVYNNQVLMATHSPAILRLAEPLNILCFAKTASGAAVVIRGNEHPRLKDWRKGVDISTLHAAGVLQ